VVVLWRRVPRVESGHWRRASPLAPGRANACISWLTVFVGAITIEALKGQRAATPVAAKFIQPRYCPA
jgi:hypothetical protein